MATPTWEGAILDAVVSYYSSNEAALLALAQSYDAPLEALIETGLTNLVDKEPVLKLILGGEIANLPAQLDPFLKTEEGYAAAAILTQLKALAAKYGG